MDAEPTTINETAQAQAARDAELMAELTDRLELAKLARNEAEEQLAIPNKRPDYATRVRQAQEQALMDSIRSVPLNREQRRAQVKAFGKLLTAVAKGSA